jgi:hypothetical protein
MSEYKNIEVNIDLFKIPSSNKTKKHKAQKEIKIKQPLKKDNKTIKHKLLKYIREQQTKHRENTVLNDNHFNDDGETHNNENVSEFNNSVNYLNNIIKNKNTTIKNRATIGFQQQLPFNGGSNSIKFNNTIVNNKQPLSTPLYGCLKGGNLPTYRQIYKTNKNVEPINKQSYPHTVPFMGSSTEHQFQLTQDGGIKTNSFLPPATEIDNKAKDIISKNKIDDKQSIKNTYILPKTKQKKTIKRTFNVGRSTHKPNISVLVSNNSIRKNITTKAYKLKQEPIENIKKYLVKNGLIKIGSPCPPDVLRNIYENSELLCGKIENHNTENIVYNFIHEKIV